MANRNTVESPIHAVADVADERITEAFSLLGDDTRVAILLALAQTSETFEQGRWDPQAVESLTFTELRNQIGADDPGNFNYHLGVLEGQFIKQTADGYELTPAGSRIVRTIITVPDFEEIALHPTEIDLPCPSCGEPTVITYQDQRMFHLCTACEGHIQASGEQPSGIISAVMTDQSILEERTPEEIVVAHYTSKCYGFMMDLLGVCPKCGGPVEATLHICDEHDPTDGRVCPACGYGYPATGRFNCSVCTHSGLWGIVELSPLVPEGIDFWLDQFTEQPSDDGGLAALRRLFDLYDEANIEILDRDPPSARVTLRDGGTSRAVTFDENLRVIEVSE